MSFVDWSPSFTVNSAALDQQHRKMLQIISDLHAAIFARTGPEAVSATIRELVEYSKTHFAEEERQMAAHGYPGLAEHRASHERLLKMVTDIENRYRQGGKSMAGDILGFLVSDWLVRHILDEDKQYAPYLKE